MDLHQNSNKNHIVTVNAGSSSLKLAIFTLDSLQKEFEAAVENIGTSAARLIVGQDISKTITISNHEDAVNLLMQQLSVFGFDSSIVAVGHRIVHGGPNYFQQIIANDEVLKDLHTFEAFDPEHLPVELNLVDVFRKIMPSAQQILCFDTGFHHDLPTHAKLLPIPRSLSKSGIYKYGFHGLSYNYILEELKRVEGEVAADGKVIIAHLGSGASLAALHHGKSIDTTMSMTPASGIPMSTRSGDIDPGIFLYLSQTRGDSPEDIDKMVNFESGLLGISETTADMERLLQIEDEDIRAKEAVDIFCYQIKKTIGSFAAALGGLNTLVFTGGIGERAPKIRAQICEGLEFLGIELDYTRNLAAERLISNDSSLVGVHVIHTDEAVTIARQTKNILYKKNYEPTHG